MPIGTDRSQGIFVNCKGIIRLTGLRLFLAPVSLKWGRFGMIERTVWKEIFVNSDGAVTLDWVALTSSVVVIGIGLVYMVYGGETGAISSMITNYNSELDQAAANLSGVVEAATPSVLE